MQAAGIVNDHMAYCSRHTGMQGRLYPVQNYVVPGSSRTCLIMCELCKSYTELCNTDSSRP